MPWSVDVTRRPYFGRGAGEEIGVDLGERGGWGRDWEEWKEGGRSDGRGNCDRDVIDEKRNVNLKKRER